MATPKSEPTETVVMTQSLVGPKTAVHKGDDYECGASEAERLIKAGFAKAKPQAA